MICYIINVVMKSLLLITSVFYIKIEVIIGNPKDAGKQLEKTQKRRMIAKRFNLT